MLSLARRANTFRTPALLFITPIADITELDNNVSAHQVL